MPVQRQPIRCTGRACRVERDSAPHLGLRVGAKPLKDAPGGAGVGCRRGAHGRVGMRGETLKVAVSNPRAGCSDGRVAAANQTAAHLRGHAALAATATPSSRLGARLIDCGMFVSLYVLLAIMLLLASVIAGPLGFVAFFSLVVLPLPLGFLYEVWPTAVSGRTLAKRLADIRVVGAETGAVPGWGGSSLRWGIPTILFLVTSGLFALLAYMWRLWDTDRQGLHDKAAGTLVIKTD